MKTTTVMIDRYEDRLELEVSYEQSATQGFWGYTIESATVNGDRIDPARVALTSREETGLRLRCVDAALDEAN